MLTALLKQTPEYKRLLAGMAGAKPAVVALFGMPPTARAQMLAALCEDTGRSALVVCAGEADATCFAEDAAVFGRRAEVFPARDYVLRPVEGQSMNTSTGALPCWATWWAAARALRARPWRPCCNIQRPNRNSAATLSR